MSDEKFPGWHGTTILAVRRGGKVVVAGDGQVSVGQTVMKGTARKVRRLFPTEDVAASSAAPITPDAAGATTPMTRRPGRRPPAAPRA